MDARQFRKQLSEKLSMSSEEVDALTEGLAMIMRERCGLSLIHISEPTRR